MIKYIQEDALECINEKMFNGYYSPLSVLKTNTPYILSYGGRNIGKTFAWKIIILSLWMNKDKKSCYMRRMADSILPQKCGDGFDKIFSSGIVKNVKKYAGIVYRSRKWCGYWEDENGKKTYDEPFCYSYALSSAIETNKGILDIENLGIIFFDEALTADNYLQDEWLRFQNAISSIIRENTSACVVMCANTVSWVAPYFREFGIKNVRSIKQGTIKVIQGIDDTAVTVEYCNDVVTSRKKRIVDRRFFGFKNGTADMITAGKWELRSYQHLTRDMIDGKNREILSRDVYVEFADEKVVLEITNLEDFGLIINVRPTDSIDYDRAVRVYTGEDVYTPIDRKKPLSSDRLDKLIWSLYKKNRFYYADNLCGEVIKKYVDFCK